MKPLNDTKTIHRMYPHMEPYSNVLLYEATSGIVILAGSATPESKAWTEAFDIIIDGEAFPVPAGGHWSETVWQPGDMKPNPIAVYKWIMDTSQQVSKN